MSTQTAAGPAKKVLSKGVKRGIWIGIVVIVIIGMVLGTKVVPNDQGSAAGEDSFDKKTYGPKNFPKIQKGVSDRAVDASTLAKAIKDDSDAAAKKYATKSSGGPVYSVSLTGKVGKDDAGIYEVKAKGVPKDLQVRVQTGPAINGTELRDATGKIQFGQFTNQIEFQDAASTLNKEMKKKVLNDVDTKHLSGKTISVTGAFTLVNPDAWLITPVELEAK